MTFLWSLPLLVLLGVSGHGWAGGPGLAAGTAIGWLALPVALLAHDLTCQLWRAVRPHLAPGTDQAQDRDEAVSVLTRCIALLVATASASAAWQWQSSLPGAPLPQAGPTLAPVLLHGLLPALLLGAPPAGVRALLGRHLQFAACTLLAALLAMLQPTLGAWLPFVLACLLAATLSSRLSSQPARHSRWR